MIVVIAIVIAIVETNGRDNRNARGVHKVSLKRCLIVIWIIINVVVVVVILIRHHHSMIVVMVDVVETLIGKKGIPMTFGVVVVVVGEGVRWRSVRIPDDDGGSNWNFLFHRHHHQGCVTG